MYGIFFTYAQQIRLIRKSTHVIHLFQTIKSLQTLQRTETQWGILVDEIFDLEDVARNQTSHDRRFKPSFPVQRPLLLRVLYNPTTGILMMHVYFLYVVMFEKKVLLV